MTIPFPHDPALPGLHVLLDEGTLSSLIATSLDIRVTGCVPKYVRYKPGTSCIVQYDLTIQDDTGGEVTQSAHIKVFSDDRAWRKAASRRSARLLERTADLEPAFRRSGYIPQIEGLLQVYPVDHDLRNLVRVSHSAVATSVLRQALQEREDPEIVGEPQLVRYKPERKALLRYQMGNHPDSTLYGKVFSAARIDRLTAQTATLIAAGIPTPPIAGSISKRHFVLHAEAAGTPLALLRDTDRYDRWMVPIAKTLWRIHAVDIPGLEVHRLANEASAITQVADTLSQVVPHLAQRLDRLGASIAARLVRLDDVLVTAHGDFYDDQAIVSDDGVTIIDLDELRRSHPLIDAGNMLAHLSSGSAFGDGNHSARERFHEEIQRHFRTSDQDIALFEAGALLKLAPGPFRRLEPEWQVGVERLLELAEAHATVATARVANANESTMPSLDVEDPALPQLNRLGDRADMSAQISRVLTDGAVSVREIDLVRHKPGRRAILRYALDTGEVVFGKTFASDRGGNVYANARTVSVANAFGPNVLMPEPIAWLPDVKLFLMRGVAGDPIEQSLLNGDTDLAARIAFALYHFHTSDIRLRRTHTMAKELHPLQSRCRDVAQVDPAMGRAAFDWLDRIQSVATRSFRWRHRPVHRDMYHDQVLRDRDRLVVLDLDDAAMSEPTVDVANFAAHLMLLGAQKCEDIAGLQTVAEVFLGQYRELDADVDDDLLAFLMATTLLRLAGIHVSRTNGRAVAGMLIDAAESLTHNQSPGR